MAEASLFVHSLDLKIYLKHTQPMLSHVNVGMGYDLSIKELADIVKEVVSFEGHITFDKSKPDGTSKKFLDVSLLAKFGWKPKVTLNEGLRRSYEEYIK